MPPAVLTISNDISYGPHPENLANCYWYSANPHSVRPGVVFVHGGGWLEGDRTIHNDDCLRVAQVHQVNAFTVGYKIGAGSYPRNVQDFRDFLAWIKGTPCTDANKVLVIGFSAGGHIALWNMVVNKNAKAFMALDGPCDLTASGGNPQPLIDAANSARGSMSLSNFSPSTYMTQPNQPMPTWWDVRSRADFIVTDHAVARDKLSWFNASSRQITLNGSHTLPDNIPERNAAIDAFIKANI